MSTTLAKGGNVGLAAAGLGHAVTIALSWQPRPGLDADCSALLLATATGKVRSDEDFIFYNQPQGANGAVRHTGKALNGGVSTDTLSVDTAALPAELDRVVVAASADGGSFGQLGQLAVTVTDPSNGASIRYDITDASTETALVFLELYQRNGEWKARAVGQGYTNGLAGLATDFGVSVEDDQAPALPPAAGAALTTAPTASPAPTLQISLEKKRLVDLEKKLTSTGNTQMISLVKSAGVSLAKRGLDEHTARVALCLDISASMNALYRHGAVQRLVERVLALGLRFDDDGEVDVFLFGKNAHRAESIRLQDLQGYTDRMLRQHRLEGATNYAKAMDLLREHYFGSAGPRSGPLADALPVYCAFVTDGSATDRGRAEAVVRAASYEPIFWQFMGIGRGFGFLEKLDDLSGRYVDNAGFFSVSEKELLGNNPISDDALFDRLMSEYPSWLGLARGRGLLR